MKPHKPFTILVALDEGNTAGRAFDEAIRIAQRIPLAGVHVVHFQDAHTSLEELERLAPALRRATVARTRELGAESLLLAIHVRAGDPVVALANLTHDLAIDLVIAPAPQRRHAVLGRDALERARIELGCALVTIPRVRHPTPLVEPLCNACAMTRAKTHNATLWCSEHRRHHPRAHGWIHRDDIAFSAHDSEFIPTGVAFD